MAAAFRIGIDLGTTHSVLAFAPVGEEDIQVFAVPQSIATGEVAPRPLLPSLRFHAAEGALAAADLPLPWPSDEPAILGAFARELGQQTPGRLVASAKSWLSHPSVDRTAAILPWGAPDEVAKVSPLEASASYLRHLRLAWDQAHPEAPLAQQPTVLTVPASFDDGARALTLQAAALAGLGTIHLIEEPQAAFYDWVFAHRADLARQLAGTRRLLVVDVGGGTTDLTLIEVTLDAAGRPQLARTGVGDHLVLGGDNMDLALARWIEPRLSGGTPGQRLSAVQLAQLTQRCRSAKERLLAPNGPAQTTVTLQGSGSRLIGGARSATLTRADVDQLLVEGFFPQVAADAQPLRARGALVEFGLPYASDAAITRHIAAFLQRQGGDLPDTLLLNGGVFHAQVLRERLLATLRSWQPPSAPPIRLLDAPRLDAAVARGAVAYAMARAGSAPRIRGGAARAYYLALEDGQGVCVLPHGTPEGEPVRLEARRFNLRLGRPVRFNLATSAVDLQHRAGDLVVLQDALQRLPPIATVLQPQAGAAGEVQVLLDAQITEVGTLEMHCVAAQPEAGRPRQRWKLEFQLRGDAATPEAATPAAAHPRLPEALAAIARVYGDKKLAVDAKEVRQLRATLERLLGERTTWPAALLRTLFGALLQGSRRRRRSLQHERTWFNLVGFTLRPGFGDPLDGWRMEQMWDLFGPGIAHSDDNQQWSEWWTLWRRIAGGLDAEQQQRVYEVIAYYLQPPGGTDIAAPEGPSMQALDELLRMAASFERIQPADKMQFGRWLLHRLQQGAAAELWWALGRLGARQPLYASLHHVLPPAVAQDWLAQIADITPDWARDESAAFAVAQIARATGDRARDLPEALRLQIAAQLQAAHAAPSWAAMVRDVTVLDEADQRRVFGEALPPGLVLVRG
ncbi:MULTISPECIES: Hsp70 family protein [unclassified Variovorax]|uniref:Hsp70 family protein n=1 Tax=unclassified Variovorax TaxID=663243 RepID=UPI0025774791|nr:MULTISPECIES: Hsp70 family protein [unclassified Variovorax]MDM0089283.1 Hsp70 family protein [Variovorax sp. J22G40]MDM0147356.1 Hsp70 family protein [Variovorax sp. J2P1-31]